MCIVHKPSCVNHTDFIFHLFFNKAPNLPLEEKIMTAHANIVSKFHQPLILLSGLGLIAISAAYIYWAGVNGAVDYENRTQCSSFLTKFVEVKLWAGTTAPLMLGLAAPAQQPQNTMMPFKRKTVLRYWLTFKI